MFCLSVKAGDLRYSDGLVVEDKPDARNVALCVLACSCWLGNSRPKELIPHGFVHIYDGSKVEERLLKRRLPYCRQAPEQVLYVCFFSKPIITRII